MGTLRRQQSNESYGFNIDKGIHEKSGHCYIESVDKETIAARKLKAGDEVVNINCKSTSGMPYEEIVAMVEEGLEVTIGFLRQKESLVFKSVGDGHAQSTIPLEKSSDQKWGFTVKNQDGATTHVIGSISEPSPGLNRLQPKDV